MARKPSGKATGVSDAKNTNDASNTTPRYTTSNKKTARAKAKNKAATTPSSQADMEPPPETVQNAQEEPPAPKPAGKNTGKFVFGTPLKQLRQPTLSWFNHKNKTKSELTTPTAPHLSTTPHSSTIISDTSVSDGQTAVSAAPLASTTSLVSTPISAATSSK
ncbi:hypothetical protein BG003_002309, partial [Podila horticola]